MSKRTMGWVLLVVLSEVLGLVVGHVFYVVCTATEDGFSYR